MYLRTVDGQAQFATQNISCTVPSDKRHAIAQFQVESNCIVCYSDTECQSAQTALQQAGIPFTVQLNTADPAHVAKAKGVHYASRSEAIDHLQNDGPVDSLLLPNILSAVKQLQADVAILKRGHP